MSVVVMEKRKSIFSLRAKQNLQVQWGAKAEKIALNLLRMIGINFFTFHCDNPCRFTLLIGPTPDTEPYFWSCNKQSKPERIAALFCSLPSHSVVKSLEHSLTPSPATSTTLAKLRDRSQHPSPAREENLPYRYTKHLLVTNWWRGTGTEPYHDDHSQARASKENIHTFSEKPTKICSTRLSSPLRG